MKTIPRCIFCDTGIYLSIGDVCSGCGAKLQLSINMCKLEEIITSSINISNNILPAQNICALVPPSSNRWNKIINRVFQSAVGFIRTI